jgi:DNA-binding transcriptional LysR family regulator
VSRQIRELEAQLGVRLFIRGHRSITFTPEGERLFRSADGAVQELQDVLGDIRQESGARPVTLSASIGVTGLWLLPRLSRFQALHPDLDLRVSANNRIADLRNDGIDLAIRYSSPALAPPAGVRLFGESVAPVAHPSFGLKAVRSVQALLKLRLLEFDDSQHPWLRWGGWLDSVGWHGAAPSGMLHFNQYDQVIHAALAGQGVALGRTKLVQPLIDEGRLVVAAIPNLPLNTTHAYWLMQAEAEPRKEVRHVSAWIEAEALRDDAASSH